MERPVSSTSPGVRRRWRPRGLLRNPVAFGTCPALPCSALLCSASPAGLHTPFQLRGESLIDLLRRRALWNAFGALNPAHSIRHPEFGICSSARAVGLLSRAMLCWDAAPVTTRNRARSGMPRPHEVLEDCSGVPVFSPDGKSAVAAKRRDCQTVCDRNDWLTDLCDACASRHNASPGWRTVAAQAASLEL